MQGRRGAMSARGSLKHSILQAFLLCPRPVIINSPDTHNSFPIMPNTIQLQPKQAIPTNGKQSVYLIPLSTKSPSSQFFPLYLVWNGRVRYTKYLHTCTSIRCVISIHVDYKNKNTMPFICMCRTGVHQYSPSLGVLAANSPDHEDSQMSGYHVF